MELLRGGAESVTQFLNASPSMVVTVLGRDTEDNVLKLRKAAKPMEVMPGFIMTAVVLLLWVLQGYKLLPEVSIAPVPDMVNVPLSKVQVILSP